MMTTDVDMESMSGSPPQTLPSSAEHAKLALPQDQMNAINAAMCRDSDISRWPILLEIEGDNPENLRKLMLAVLMRLTLILSRNGFNISVLQVEEADTIVESFNESEYKEWEAGLRTGVKTGNWEHLVVHRTYHPIPNGRMAFRIFISKVDRYLSTAFLRPRAPGNGASYRSSLIPHDPERCKLSR